MPRLTGPLHSDAASGTLAGQLTFQRHRGSTIVRIKPTPRQPNSTAQNAIRATTKALMRIWQTLTPDQRYQWAALAAQTNIATNNAFFSTNWQRHRHALDPIMTPTERSAPQIRTFAASTFTPKTFSAETIADR